MLGRERSTWLPVRRRLLTVALGLAVILVGVATPAASAQFLFGFNEGRVFGAGNVYLGDAVANREAQVSSRVQRFFVEWSDVEPNAPRGGSHTYDWSSTGYDRLAASLRGQGIRPLIGLLAAPPWAHGPLDGIGPGTPPDGSHLDDFAAFAAAVARHFPDAVAIEVWNEPNFASSDSWSAIGGANPGRYATMFNAARDAIAAVTPGLPVITGSLTGRLQDTFAGDLTIPDFLNSLLPRIAGHLRPGDAIGVHIYPSGWPDPSDALDRTLTQVREARNAFTPGRQLWITELGLSTGGPIGDPNVVSEAAQALGLTAIYHQIATTAEGSDIGALLIHTVIAPLGVPLDTLEAGYALTTGNELAPKPALCALATARGRGVPPGCPAASSSPAPRKPLRRCKGSRPRRSRASSPPASKCRKATPKRRRSPLVRSHVRLS